ncbi:MAG: S9 family peptidase [Thermoplasmata archaeon]|uniref:S9 family peptidase n=1 Tax=Candidatus Sysuiplasma superficiale TaxID=2823368 RepID=A0A8J7YV64_9ARCH|nr:S9 family peptidase [Candidatus Sysuiplasma superficiale]
MVKSDRHLSHLSYDRFTQYFRYGAVDTLGDNSVIYTSDINGQFNIWTQSYSGNAVPGYQRMLTAFHDRTVRDFAVSPDGRQIYFMADCNGNEQFQIYRIGSSGGDPISITSDETVRHELNKGSIHPGGKLIAYCDNSRTRTDFDLVIMDIRSGREKRPLHEGVIWAFPVWDKTGTCLTATQINSNTDMHSFIYNMRKSKTAEIMPHAEEGVVAAVGWTEEGKVLVVSDIGHEFRNLFLYNPENEKLMPVFEGKNDVDGALYTPVTGEVVYAINTDGYTELYRGRPGSRFARIQMPCRGHLSSVLSGMSVDLKRRNLAIVWAPDNRPPEIAIVGLSKRKSSILTDSMAGGVPGNIPSPELVHFESFDGRMIPAFYYRPAGRRSRFPAVLSIHGGPESQERPGWGYEGLYQFLQCSGIAVLCPNIRGSTGYGKSYQKLIHRDWGGDELRDLRAAAEWLRNRREVDGEGMAVFGGSFGGFAALSCVTRLPEFWTAGVDICGPSNLVTFCKSVPPFWKRFMRDWVGDADTEADFLMERSPITYIDRTKADMLIIQGANDPRVVKEESDQMVERLRQLGRYVEYIVFPDEGHGFTKSENARKGFGAVARFLVERLRGKD